MIGLHSLLEQGKKRNSGLMNRQKHVSAWMVVLLATLGATAAYEGTVWAEKTPGHLHTNESVRLALHYAEAFTSGRSNDWARHDLGCLSRFRAAKAGSPETRAGIAQTCYTDTLNAHRALLLEKSEAGILGPNSRGQGFGLISERHRHAGLWKSYPPAVFFSPAVGLKPLPMIEARAVSPVQPTTLVQGASAPVTVGGTLVELSITYPDPLTAPLALAPGESWWANGASRRYQPVRTVVIRLVVVGNLRLLGYAEDRAVVNEALSDAPQILTTSYGMNATSDALQPATRGHFVLGSAQWWTPEIAGERYRTWVKQAETMTDRQEKRALLASLLLIDSNDVQVNSQLGALEFETFLLEGLAKGGITAQDNSTRQRVAELYWNLQAQTWRQELTDVAVGHSQAAEAFYAALRTLDAAVASGTASPELQRQLGLLHRWNNNVQEAITLHESLLSATKPEDRTTRGRLLAELAWDRIQWVSWERRYDHPWLQQAQEEARQAMELADTPIERLLPAQVLLLSEALTFTRTTEGLQSHLHVVKDNHDRLNGVTGLWPHLVGNDVVKALVPDGQHITLPTTTRASDVLDVQIHATPPPQNIVWQWNFEQDALNTVPAGFVALSTPGAAPSGWRVLSDGQPSTPGKLVIQDRPCGTEPCAHLLLADRIRTTYPDATVQLASLPSGGEAGIALAVRDNRNFYAVTLNPTTGKLTTRRVADGRTSVLGETTVKLTQRPWHTLRVQRINFLHLDRGRLSVFVDGAQVVAVADEWFNPEGSIGLITIGQGAAQFDGLHLLDLVSNRTFSGPAAY
jgi:hypothetical protein